MYLEHFNFKSYPFLLTPDTDFFCNLNQYQASLNVLLISVRQGEGFLKIIGEVGTGKTLLCRMLLGILKKECVTAYIPHPDLSPVDLNYKLAQELGIKNAYKLQPHQLKEVITNQLIAYHQQGQRVVLVVDEAQALPYETLEGLRLLTNLETTKIKLLQVVLFAQPELESRLKEKNLRQLKQRITFEYYLGPLNKQELESYLTHRLSQAGHTFGALFTPAAIRLLYRYSQGIPRIINILCHKALLAAYGKGSTQVNQQAMKAAIKDTLPVTHKIWSLILIGVFLITATCFIRDLYPDMHVFFMKETLLSDASARKSHHHASEASERTIDSDAISNRLGGNDIISG